MAKKRIYFRCHFYNWICNITGWKFLLKKLLSGVAFYFKVSGEIFESLCSLCENLALLCCYFSYPQRSAKFFAKDARRKDYEYSGYGGIQRPILNSYRLY